MFRTVPLSIISSFSLNTQQRYMSYSSTCPKYVEFYSKNKFEKLMHLVGFVIRIYHDARSAERQNARNSLLIWAVLTKMAAHGYLN